MCRGKYAISLFVVFTFLFTFTSNAHLSAMDITVNGVAPAAVSTWGGNRVEIRGSGFNATQTFWVGQRRLANVDVQSMTRVRATVPPMDAGSFPVSVRGIGGDVVAELDNGLEVVTTEIFDVVPEVVSTDGGTQITYHGKGFSPLLAPRLGGTTLFNFQLEGPDRLRFISPALPPGPHTADIVTNNQFPEVVAQAKDPIFAGDTPFVTAVIPETVRAGDSVRILGENFRLDGSQLVTRIFFGANEVEDARPILVNGVPAISATTPALGAGETPGTFDVRAVDPILGSRTTDTLVTYLPDEQPPALPPPPQQLEAALAYDVEAGNYTARFSWYNCTNYSEINIYDMSGNLLAALDGDATEWEAVVGSPDVPFEIQMESVKDNGLKSEVLDGVAQARICLEPAPLMGVGSDGGYDLSLRGNHPRAFVERCVDPAAAGGGAVLDESASIGDLTGESISANGTGVIHQERFRIEQANSLTTGFVLEEDATVLEIAGWYQKIAAGLDVELRGKITQVLSDGTPGFVDEFTFPSTTIDTRKKDWHCVNYYRADRDVSHVPDPSDPDDGPAEPCRDGSNEILPMPAGNYLLEMYVTGGDVQVPYHVFGDDDRDYELLIPGAPCPPYPLVRIRDLSGRRTLPSIVEVTAETLNDATKSVELTAIGSWLDADGNVHPVGPGEPDDPGFEYIWTISDKGGVPTTVCSGSSSSVVVCVEDWGCYTIDLEVRDANCPRSNERSFQIAAAPADIVPEESYFSFFYPTPEPSGIHAIVGLDPEPGTGSFDGKRPVEFTVAVVPECYGTGATPCDAVQVGDVEFTLAEEGFVIQQPFGDPIQTYDPIDGVTVVVEDLCPDVDEGVKFLHIRIDDLGSIPNLPGADGDNFLPIYFVGKTVEYNGASVSSRWSQIGDSGLFLVNPPQVLEESHWSGYFDEEDATYHFTTRASEDERQGFAMDDSNQVDLPIEGLPPGVGIPAFSNDLSTGFSSRIIMHGGSYTAESGSGGTHGDTMGNQVEGEPVNVLPTIIGQRLEDIEYTWEDEREVFSQDISQEIFNSILFAGSVGPVPVTIWASVGFGMQMAMNAYTNFTVRPFATDEPNTEANFYLCTDLGISIPASIRADIAFGVVSLTTRLTPTVTADLDTRVGAIDAIPTMGLFAGVYLSLYFQLEACVWALLDEVCLDIVNATILDEEPLFEQSLFDERDAQCAYYEDAGDECAHNFCEVQEDPSKAGAGGGLASPQARWIRDGDAFDGGGAGVALPPGSILSSSRTGASISPDGTTQLCASVAEDLLDGDDIHTRALYFTNHDVAAVNDFTIQNVLDPYSTFLSNSVAMIVWTQENLPFVVIGGDDLAQRNAIAAGQDILITPIHDTGSDTWRTIGESSFIQVSDAPGEVPASGKRADGMAVIAADPSTSSDAPAGGEALVAWVRYEGDFLVEGAARDFHTYEKNEDGSGYFPLMPVLAPVEPNLRTTAIYTRRVDLNGVMGDAEKISPEGDGINIEPTLAIAPSGDVAMCVWVHDPVNSNLIDSNLGRNFMVSKYTKTGPGTGTWDAPLDLLPNPDDYPGLLEPFLTLKGDDEGALAFSALEPGAELNDTGLGGNRYIFVSLLEDGVFGEPVLIHGKCLTAEYGMMPQISWVPDTMTFESAEGRVDLGSSDYVLTYLGTGPLGLRSGSGNIMSASLGRNSQKWGAPVCLTDDDNIHSNLMSAVSRDGTLHTVHLNEGPAKLPLNHTGGVPDLKSRRTLEIRNNLLVCDPAIQSCKLSDQFPGPGGRVRATVGVSNDGFSNLPRRQGGSSAVGVELVFVTDLGLEHVLAQRPVPQIEPGNATELQFSIEMPHTPGKLITRLAPNPVDRDTTNNQRECIFGAPPVKAFVVASDFDLLRKRGDATLSWQNPIRYDEIWVYRDGGMIAKLSGSAAFFRDLYTSPGEHVYELRGVVGASKSRRVAALAVVPAEPTTSRFIRGDANDDGSVNIADPSFISNYVFGISPATVPACAAAADANGDGSINIADPSYVSNFVFGIGTAAPPPAPFPRCGFDERAEEVGPCESVFCE